MNVLATEKYKQCEIYGKVFDVYIEACFSQKMFSNGINMGLPLQARVIDNFNRAATWRLSGK